MLLLHALPSLEWVLKALQAGVSSADGSRVLIYLRKHVSDAALPSIAFLYPEHRQQREVEGGHLFPFYFRLIIFYLFLYVSLV